MRTAMAQGARKAMAAVFGQRVADAAIAALRAGIRADAIATTEAALTDTVDAKPVQVFTPSDRDAYLRAVPFAPDAPGPRWHPDDDGYDLIHGNTTTAPQVCYLTIEEYAAYFDRIHAAEGDR